MGGVDWSIIIPARNEEKHIDLCLQSLCKLEGSGRFEVIVVDNGSTDRTVAIVHSYRERLHLRLAVEQTATVGGLRNLGAGLAEGMYLAFLDADCLAPPSWLRDASQVLRHHPAAVAGSPYALPPEARWPARVWHARFHEGKQGEAAYVPGGCMLMERSVFWKVGGFDSRLRSNEDSQFCSRARASGLPVFVAPSLSVTHLGVETSLLHFARRQRWHGSNVINRAGFRGNVRAIALAAYTLLCLLAIAAFALSFRPFAAALGFGILLLPVFWMGFRPGRGGRSRNPLPLLLLLLVYAVVRACVLPAAVFRAARQVLLQPQPLPGTREDGRAFRT